MHWTDIVTTVLLALGCFLALTGGIGMLRLPDFYTRLHPAGKIDALAQMLILAGLLFQCDSDFTTTPVLTACRLVVIILVVLITAPTATHAITKAALLDGLEPWTRGHAPGGESAFDRAAPGVTNDRPPHDQPDDRGGAS